MTPMGSPPSAKAKAVQQPTAITTAMAMRTVLLPMRWALRELVAFFIWFFLLMVFKVFIDFIAGQKNKVGTFSIGLCILQLVYKEGGKAEVIRAVEIRRCISVCGS